MNGRSAVDHIRQLLALSRALLVQDPYLASETGDTNAKGDRTIRMDVKVEDAVVDYAKRQGLPVAIFSEERGMLTVADAPTELLVIDPLDGSLNYQIGKGILPFGTLIAVFSLADLLLNKVLAAGALERTRDVAWIYDGEHTSALSGSHVRLDGEWTFDHSLPVYVDLSRPNAYGRYSKLSEEVLIRDSGSNVGNLSFVLSNVAAAIGAVSMRPEEVAAVYGLVTGAGGVVEDTCGRDLGVKTFSTDMTYEVVAGPRRCVEALTRKLNRST